MDLYWLEQIETCVPQANGWLSPGEAAHLAGLRYAVRHNSWRLGRWTAKLAVASYLHLSHSFPALAKIEVRPAPSGAPEVFFENQLAPLTISLSHREDRAICVVAPAAVELGCDLELIEPHSDAFIADYFVTEEQALVARQPVADRPRFLALLWSAKESALKALRTGLRLDTRCVIVDLLSPPAASGWGELQVRYAEGKIFHGWWQVADGMVRTVVAAPPPGPPIPLETTARTPDGPPCNHDPRRFLETHDLCRATYGIAQWPIRL